MNNFDSFLFDLEYHLEKTLEGHTKPICSIAFNQSDLLATGSFDRTVCIWNTATGSLFQRLEGHEITGNSVAFSRDGNLLAWGSSDKKVHIWNTATGQFVKELLGHENVVTAIAFNHTKLLASASYDDTVRIWNTDSWELEKELNIGE